MNRETGLPDVSVVMPAFNASRSIVESILSVQAQTHASLELIVVDDGSTDDTVSLVQRLARDDGRIRLLKNTSNRGVSFSRNQGVEESRGRFLMFLDSDDLWESSKVETQVAFMQRTGCAISYMDYSRFNDASGETTRRVTSPDAITYQDLLASNEIGMLTAAIDLYRVRKLPKFQVRGHEDYVFWLDLLKDQRMTALKAPSSKPLAHYRDRAGSVSSNYMRSALWHWQVLARQKQALPIRIRLMMQYLWHALSKRNTIQRYFSGPAK